MATIEQVCEARDALEVNIYGMIRSFEDAMGVEVSGLRLERLDVATHDRPAANILVVTVEIKLPGRHR